ncbi:MAG TPA: TolC family protein [Candidatus Eremiobacteraceae bacterium]|nr:TolC family protein [Candidatus Eremiobacteraceae bacterium]
MRVALAVALIATGLTAAARPDLALAAAHAAPAPSSSPAAPATPASMPTSSATAGSKGPVVRMTLADALSLASTNNLTYQAALADQKAAAARVVAASAGKIPSLTAAASRQHTQSAGAFNFPSPKGPVSFPISATNYSSISETIQWAIYTGGAVEAEIGEAAAGFASAQDGVAATRADVINDTTTKYFGLLAAQQRATIADKAVVVARDDEKLAEQQFNAGTAARADVLREQVTLANAQVSAVQADNDAALANADLANTLNIDLGSSIQPTENLNAAVPAFSLDEILEDARAKRPELASSQDAVTIAADTVKAARAGTLPTLALQVQNAGLTPNFENIKQPQLSETLSITWKLFDGGMTHGEVAQAQAEVDKAQINLKQLQNGVDLEARQAYLNYVAAQAQLVAARSAQSSAAEDLRVTRIRFQAGVGTSLELSDALLADTQAKTQYVTAQAGVQSALVTLKRAAGLL